MAHSKSDRLTGGCACGAITFEVVFNDPWVGYCHCNDCKKATGAPVSCYLGAKAEDVTFARDPKSFATSSGVKRSWCETCGTPLTYQSVRWPGEIHFHIAAFDHPETIEPHFHGYTKEQLPWLNIVDDLHRTKEPNQ